MATPPSLDNQFAKMRSKLAQRDVLQADESPCIALGKRLACEFDVCMEKHNYKQERCQVLCIQFSKNKTWCLLALKIVFFFLLHINVQYLVDQIKACWEQEKARSASASATSTSSESRNSKK